MWNSNLKPCRMIAMLQVLFFSDPKLFNRSNQWTLGGLQQAEYVVRWGDWTFLEFSQRKGHSKGMQQVLFAVWGSELEECHLHRWLRLWTFGYSKCHGELHARNRDRQRWIGRCEWPFVQSQNEDFQNARWADRRGGTQIWTQRNCWNASLFQ